MPRAEHHTEFYPEGTNDRSGYCVEIASSWAGEGGYDVTLWISSSGRSMNQPIRTLEKARRVAKFLYHTFKPEVEFSVRERKRLNAERHEIDKVRWAEEAERERVAYEARLAKITPDTERVTMAVCPTCQHHGDPEEFEDSVYECGTCGTTQVGVENRRCEQCHKFMAKIGEVACPSCEVGLDEEPDTVVGVLIDGVFVSEAEIAAGV